RPPRALHSCPTRRSSDLFAMDPPHVPDENPTGDYRREFTIEDQWLDAGRVLLRFDGVESFFQLWVNGAPVGSASGSRLAHEFDRSEEHTSELQSRFDLVC